MPASQPGEPPPGETLQVGFYHCTRSPALDVAVQLAGKCWDSRTRLLIVAEAETLATLDRRLWTDDPASFLPHGLATGPEPDAQPILLAGTADPPANAASWAMFVGIVLPEDAAARFERLFVLFEDRTPAHAAAREAWRALKSRSDIERSYWQQRNGKWAEAG
jgi:DNA polymerase-3 subunit chi